MAAPLYITDVDALRDSSAELIVNQAEIAYVRVFSLADKLHQEHGPTSGGKTWEL